MQYFAGLFDAEGYVSLGKEGRFHIGTEMTNEEVPKLFKDTFGGNIYSRTRENRKKTYTWVISTNIQVSLNFIDQIAPYSIIKKTQLLRLRDYLDQTREFKRQIRDEVSHQLSCLKKPLPLTKEQINVETNQIINKDFLMWFAGFIDGDGNICVF